MFRGLGAMPRASVRDSTCAFKPGHGPGATGLLYPVYDRQI